MSAETFPFYIFTSPTPLLSFSLCSSDVIFLLIKYDSSFDTNLSKKLIHVYRNGEGGSCIMFLLHFVFLKFLIFVCYDLDPFLTSPLIKTKLRNFYTLHYLSSCGIFYFSVTYIEITSVMCLYHFFFV